MDKSESNREKVRRQRWDSYYHKLCIAVASKSPCLSRKIGAILVRDKSVVSTGYNGPPRGIPHCGQPRFLSDRLISKLLTNNKDYKKVYGVSDISNTCPRRLLSYPSGEGMELCPAQHAEENAISNAARLGVSTTGSILYMNSITPCSKCFGTLINAGIAEIVVESAIFFDQYTVFLYNNSKIEVREFIHGG